MPPVLHIPRFSVVVLIGVSGAGKSFFARKHFRPTQVLSSDACRALVSDDENNMAATADAFALLHYMLEKRLRRRRLSVVDATNLKPSDRAPLLDLAKEFSAPAVGFVFDLPEETCLRQNQRRSHRTLEPEVIARQRETLHRYLPGLEREGFRKIHTFASPEEVDSVVLRREPAPSRKRVLPARHSPG